MTFIQLNKLCYHFESINLFGEGTTLFLLLPVKRVVQNFRDPATCYSHFKTHIWPTADSQKRLPAGDLLVNQILVGLQTAGATFRSIYQNLRWILIVLTFTYVVSSSKELLFGGYSLFVFTAVRHEAKGTSTVDFRPVTACMAFHRQTILISANSDWLITVGRLF